METNNDFLYVLFLIEQFIIQSKKMEIPDLPDLHFKIIKAEIPVCDSTDFYSIQISQIESIAEQCQFILSYEQNFKPIIEEQIEKKTLNISWRSRYFSLTQCRLLYYETIDKSSLKGCFNFSSLLCHDLRLQSIDNKLILTVKGNAKEENGKNERKEILVLNFENKLQRIQVWKNKIEEVLRKIILNQKYQAPKITSNQIESCHCKLYNYNFWNRIYVSNQELLTYANHLDLVFFKSKTTMASIHRLFMRSNFDHVGLLFRDSCNRLLILEAIESRGVWINEWNSMLPSFQEHYEEIAIRKLITSNKKIDIEKLQNYLDIVIGQKYQLSISKLFVGENQSTNEDFENEQVNYKKNSQKKISSQGNIKLKKQKTFFCSQLIADVYIKCGLIKGRKKNQFWPKDFQSNDLKLQNETSLSPLMYLAL